MCLAETEGVTRRCPTLSCTALTSVWRIHAALCLTVAASETWSQPYVTGFAPSPRGGHACVAVGDRVYVYGGMIGMQALGDIFVLDMRTHEPVATL